MSYETIELDVADGLATLTLNRPERLNAFNRQLLIDLKAAWAKIADDKAIRAVLLTGAGRGFCAGADLAAAAQEKSAGPRDAGAILEEFYNPMILKMRGLGKPIVAAVNGPAAGAGMSLALACDIVLAAKSASFLQAFARIGLMPDAGSTWLLPRLVGDARARALAMLAPQIGADEALKLGLVWQVVDDAALMGEARKIAMQLAEGPSLAYAGIKRAIGAAWGNDLPQGLQLERELQSKVSGSDDFEEGVKAFLGKRKANYRGQ
ncbi:MAG: enoyl-CoA hydratase-related protein [Alphaproteobacteria bacterium]